MSSDSLYWFINSRKPELQVYVEFDNYTPLHRLLAYIYYLPISTRKLLLDACRIQQPFAHNKALIQSASSIKDFGTSYTVGIQKRGHTRHQQVFADIMTRQRISCLRVVVKTLESVCMNSQ